MPDSLRRWLVILGAVIYQGQQHLEAPLDRERLETHLSAQWMVMPLHLRINCQILAFVFEWSALFRFGARFSLAPPPKQLDWIRVWSTNRYALYRLSIRLLLTLVKPSYFQQPDVTASIRYERKVLTATIPTIEEPPLLSQTVAENRHHQVIVIGTGAGGAVIGAELAQAGYDVAFIESGVLHSAESFLDPPLETLRKTYRDGGLSIAYGRPNIPLPQGETVGGSTTINSGTCFRIPQYVSDKFVAAQIGLSTEVLAPHYDAVEHRLGVQPVAPGLLGGSSTVIAKGAESLGLDHGPLNRNIRGCAQSGQCAFGCPRAAKQAMHLTYLPDALANGATLYAGTKADRILFHGNRAVGVTVTPSAGGPSTVISADIVVSACGTIRGVPFLKKSGIRSPHLGRHLSIHPASKITALMPNLVTGWADTPQGYGIFDLINEGIVFEGAYVPPEYGVVSLPYVGDTLDRIMANYDRLAIFGLFVADGPNGQVHMLPNGNPLVRYWLSSTDAERFRIGLQLLSKVFFEAGAEEIFLPIAGREYQANLDSALQTLSQPINPWDLELVAFHPLGTARMSTSAHTGVTRPDGQIWGYQNVYVADGSLFPSSLGVNPQLTIMATARHVAQQIISTL